MYVLKDLLISMSEQNASDLHLTLGSPPRIRINGKLNPIEGNKLNATDITQMLQEYLSDNQLKTINAGTELDFTIGIPGLKMPPAPEVKTLLWLSITLSFLMY